jgi:hypothetical protein
MGKWRYKSIVVYIYYHFSGFIYELSLNVFCSIILNLDTEVKGQPHAPAK